MPWLFIPVLWALCLDFHEIWYWSGHEYLFLPLAIWLSSEYQKNGFIAAAIGGLPLVAAIDSDVFSTIGSIALYIAGLLYAHLVADERAAEQFKRWLLNPLVLMSVAFVAFLGIKWTVTDQISVFFSFKYCVYVLPFFLGLWGVEYREPLKAALWVFLATSILAPLLPKFSVGAVGLSYGHLNASTLLAMCALYVLGDMLRRTLSGQRVDHWRSQLGVGGVLLAGLVIAMVTIVVKIPLVTSDVGSVGFFLSGSDLMAIAVGTLAGLAFGGFGSVLLIVGICVVVGIEPALLDALFGVDHVVGGEKFSISGRDDDTLHARDIVIVAGSYVVGLELNARFKHSRRLAHESEPPVSEVQSTIS
jgi:hypothetical protein